MHALPHAGVGLSGEVNLDTLAEPGWRSDSLFGDSFSDSFSGPLSGPSVALLMGRLWCQQFATE